MFALQDVATSCMAALFGKGQEQFAFFARKNYLMPRGFYVLGLKKLSFKEIA